MLKYNGYKLSQLKKPSKWVTRLTYILFECTLEVLYKTLNYLRSLFVVKSHKTRIWLILLPLLEHVTDIVYEIFMTVMVSLRMFIISKDNILLQFIFVYHIIVLWGGYEELGLWADIYCTIRNDRE